ncbi:MAG: hypothetical protein KJ799_15215 [Bacteroidetes bacterium]|nr:hypothetical protein [Bacteroidota bacterium]MBU1679929.1 hypothetical protein [Bacteroidota bacterium]MBU2508054.1 hypothetical protein [Bacteroidota bacterium]
MVIDLIVHVTDDGYTAEIPSLKGCETWAHTEDDSIEKAIELLKYYIGLPDESKIIVDRARKGKTKTVYKLVFDKE